MHCTFELHSVHWLPFSPASVVRPRRLFRWQKSQRHCRHHTADSGYRGILSSLIAPDEVLVSRNASDALRTRFVWKFTYIPTRVDTLVIVRSRQMATVPCCPLTARTTCCTAAGTSRRRVPSLPRSSSLSSWRSRRTHTWCAGSRRR
jgi:hypothetical protein